MIEVRSHLKDLQPYSSARDDFQGQADIFLDANENPFGQYNRYPDSKQKQLKQKLSALKGLPTNHIFIGNGSDEIIDLVMRLYCEPNEDEILIFPPTYGMYEVSAKINHLQVNEIALTEDFQLDLDAIERVCKENDRIKICFVCSPNNPTGNVLHNIDRLCKQFNGLVVVDEAYIDFAEQNSMMEYLGQYDNLLVSQTFSKAWAMAAARVGVAYSSPEIIHWLTAIKPPYNVSALNQNAALATLEHKTNIEQQVNEIIAQRKWLIDQLKQIDFVDTIFPTDANFILLRVDDASKRYEQLKHHGIVIRNRHRLVDQCIRITVGSKDENQQLIQTMKLLSEQ